VNDARHIAVMRRSEMKTESILAGLIVLTLARAAVAAETVDVKYRGKVDLAPFTCVAVSRSS
jgi:hypothetical protein